jgi:hypothetical protein
LGTRYCKPWRWMRKANSKIPLFNFFGAIPISNQGRSHISDFLHGYSEPFPQYEVAILTVPDQSFGSLRTIMSSNSTPTKGDEPSLTTGIHSSSCE